MQNLQNTIWYLRSIIAQPLFMHMARGRQWSGRGIVNINQATDFRGLCEHLRYIINMLNSVPSLPLRPNIRMNQSIKTKNGWEGDYFLFLFFVGAGKRPSFNKDLMVAKTPGASCRACVRCCTVNFSNCLRYRAGWR